MSNQTITLVQMNDTHAYFDIHPELFWHGDRAVYRPAGGYARIATVLRQIRAEQSDRVLFYDNGDTLHGTYAAVKTEGRAMIPILNALGISAMTAHWEFAYGPDIFRERAAELNYPMLAANVCDKETGDFAFAPFAVHEVGNLRVGVIGLASNIIDRAMPASFSTGLSFELGKEELPRLIEHLRKQERVDLVVLLSHLGFPQDLKLVSEVAGIDVCLSGHTHNRIYEPVRQGNTLVIQSGCHGSFLGRLDLTIDGRRVVDARHNLIEIGAGIVPDPDVDALVQSALTPFRAELGEVVGETATALNRATTLEATMDNFLLQALQATTGAELAFSNGWRYGAPVVPGPITRNDLYNIVPMNPPISTVELTGEELLEMLEENLNRTFAPDPYEQMGGYVKRTLGCTVYVKLENPRGQRIQQLFVGDEEVQRQRVYGAAFVTEQGVASKYGRNREKQGTRAVEAMSQYLASHGRVEAELRGTFRPV